MLLHLLFRDIRRLRLAIAGWILVIAVISVVYGFQPIYSTSPRFAYTGWLAHTLLFWSMQLFTVVLAPLVVQADAAVGTDAFWMTRPIRPAVLATSKLLLLLILLVVVPTASMMAIMTAYHVPAGEVMRAGLEMAILQALWIAVLAVAAALTGNIARFAVLCGASLAVMAVTLGISEAVAAARLATQVATTRLTFRASGYVGPMPPDLLTRPAIDHTPELVAILLAIAGGIGLVIVQYRTRLRRRSIPIGVAGLLLACLSSALWPWALLQTKPAPPAWATAADALRLSADQGSIRTNPVSKRPAGDRPQQVGTLFNARLNGLSPGWVPTVTLATASLQLGGVRLQSAAWGFPAEPAIGSSDESARRIVLRQVLGVEQLLEPVSGHELLEALSLQDDEVVRYAPAMGRYSGRFRIALTRAEVVASIPLKPGAIGQAGALRLAIDGVSARNGGNGGVRPMALPPGQLWNVMVAVRESNATSLFDGAPASSQWYYLRNQARKQAIQGSAPPDGAISFPLPGLIHPSSLPPRLFLALYDVSMSGFRARGVVINFFAMTDTPLDDESALDGWLADAELVVVRMTNAGWVERTLDIPEFPLVPSKPGDPGPAGIPFGRSR